MTAFGDSQEHLNLSRVSVPRRTPMTTRSTVPAARGMNIQVVAVGELGDQALSRLVGMVHPDGDERFDVVAPDGLAQLYAGGAHADMCFIVGDARDHLAANAMLRTRRVVERFDPTLTFLVSPIVPEVVHRDLRGLDCCVLEVGDVDAPELAAQAVLGVNHAMMVPGLVGICFDDLRRLFRGRCSGWSAHRSGPGGGEAGARDLTHETIAAIGRPALVEKPAKCLAVVYVGPDGSLHEVHAASLAVQDALHDDSDVVLAAAIDDDLTGTIGVTVIVATRQHWSQGRPH